MKHLVIIGARGYGREVYALAKNLRKTVEVDWDIKGFLDDKIDAFDGLICDYPPILGPVETYEVQPDDVFICALGNGVYRKKYAEIILAKHGEFISLVDPAARVMDTAKIGRGCIIGRWTIVSDNVEIGDFTMVHSFTTFGHDVKIGRYNSIESYVFFGGGSSTGELSTMHAKSSIISHKRIGNCVSVGFGSAVMRNFGDNQSLFGTPAKRMDF